MSDETLVDLAPSRSAADRHRQRQAASRSGFRLLGLRDADRLLKGGLALVELFFGGEHSPGKAVRFRIPPMLAGGTCYSQSVPQCGQCRRPIAVPRQTLGQEREPIRQKDSTSEPGPVRYALADAGDCFVDGTLSNSATPRSMPGSKVNERRCSAASASAASSWRRARSGSRRLR